MLTLATEQTTVSGRLKMKRKKVEHYIKHIRNDAKREYAKAYAAYLLDGKPEPDRGTLGYMGAQAVRMNLAELIKT